MTRLRAAVVQAAPIVFDPDRTLDKLEALAREAASGGASLVVFPEAFVSAYPRGLDFGARIGERTREGREAFQRYYASSIDVPGEATERMGAMAAELGVHLVVGVVEREMGTLYCSVVFLGPDGRLLGKHRKVMPTASERLVWGFGDASTLPVLDTPIGKLGAVICWENYMPLLRAAMYAKGIELYCAPTADTRDSWLATARHVALEGRCFVLSCCQFQRKRDLPEDYPAFRELEPEAIVTRGGSVIVSPLGQVLAGPNYEGEAILTAELDLGEITRAKYDFDAVGHYARPDLFHLQVDERPKPFSSSISDRTPPTLE